MAAATQLRFTETGWELVALVLLEAIEQHRRDIHETSSPPAAFGEADDRLYQAAKDAVGADRTGVAR